jgi:hypothetical protein
MIGPLFELNDEARLTMSPSMAKRLKIAGLEHIGKNISLTLSYPTITNNTN